MGALIRDSFRGGLLLGERGFSMATDESAPPRVLGLFGLAMINIVAIASLRDLPQMASYGIGSIFFYVLAALVFFFLASCLLRRIS